MLKLPLARAGDWLQRRRVLFESGPVIRRRQHLKLRPVVFDTQEATDVLIRVPSLPRLTNLQGEV